MKSKLLLIFIMMLFVLHSFAQTIQLTNISQDVFCSTGKDTLKFSVNYTNIPQNSNIVLYQSTNPAFNPYLGQGDSIGFLNVGGNTSSGSQITTLCPRILGIFIDACNQPPLDEADNEYMVITSGTGFLVNNLKLQMPNTAINISPSPCVFATPSAATMAQLRNGTCNGTTLLAAGQGDSIPPNAIVIIFTGNGPLYNYNFSSYCSSGQPIYILQNSCSPGTANFVNNAPSACPNAFRTTTITNRGCVNSLTYAPCSLPPFDAANPNANDGNYVIHLPNTDTSSILNGGIKNNMADKCNGLRYDSISGTTIIKFPIPNDGSANATTNFCNTGYHYIKAITHPNGSQPVSNNIQFKLVCLDVSTTITRQEICSYDFTYIPISSTDVSATFSWTVSGGTSISGASSGPGPLISHQLSLNDNSIPSDSLIYNITASDNGCTKLTSVKVVVNKCSTCTAFNLGNDTTYCGAFSRVLSTGISATVWSTGVTASSITVTQAGTYTATCGAFSDAITILQKNAPSPVNLGVDAAVCSPINYVLSTGDNTTVWSTGVTASSIIVTQAGTYTATITNTCGKVSDTITITQTNSQPPINLGNDTSYCGAFSRTLSTGNPATVWSTGVTAAAITVSTPGTYTATITSACGNASDAIVITQSAGINFDFGASSTSVCIGGSITLDASTTYDSYLWSTGAIIHAITITQPGKYWVDVFKNGCKGSDTISVILIDKEPKPNLGIDTSYCGSFSRLLSTGNAQTQWLRNGTLITTASTFTVNQSGTYVAIISNSCGSVSDTVIISNTNGLNVNLGRDTTICTGNQLTLNATVPGNNISYSWNTGEQTPTILVSQFGKYDVTVSNGGCSVSDTILVDVVDPPVITTLGNDTSLCGSLSFPLFTGDAGTIWSTGVTGPQITVTQPGTYIAENKNQCGSAKDTIVIKQFALPVVNIGKDSTICDSIRLSVGNGRFASILWSTGDSTPSIVVTATGVFTVKVSNLNCTNSDSVRITKECFYDVYIPTAFSPNGDGVNDIYVPLSTIKGMQILDFIIFNRWGEKVFESKNFIPNDITNGWNGTYKGANCQVDNYVFLFTAKMLDDKIKIYKGTFALLR